MITTITKRDGRSVPFNFEKVAKAIFKAAQAAGGNNYDEALELSYRVCDYIEETLMTKNPSVEQVQDAVEKVLVEAGHTKTAKKYILYRAERTRVREMNSKLMRTFEDLTFKSSDEVEIKRENANIDGDTAMGTMLRYGSESSKQFYEMFVLDPDHANAHIRGDIHIHDLDFYTLTTTCAQIDIVKLFKGGFCTGHGFLREPNDIRSYSALACIAIQSNQNDQHGGQSIPNFDYGMAKGVAKTYTKLYRANLAKALELICGAENSQEMAKELMAEIDAKTGIVPKLLTENGYREAEREVLLKSYDKTLVEKVQKFTKKEAENETDKTTYQAMEALIHNLNTMHSRAGAQIPFSSINYGTDVSPEGRMAVKNLLLAQQKGLGDGETPIFPIHIFKVKEGINYNKEDPNYDLFKLACKVSAKRLFPNFSFMD
ncbi:MAG: anaerobic ribonucleoside-triphosphate reductase, partial [Oscillospiraceae bacterium]